MLDKFSIVCPTCGTSIVVPFLRKLQAKAIKEADILEISSKERLDELELFFLKASLYDIFKFWRQLKKG